MTSGGLPGPRRGGRVWPDLPWLAAIGVVALSHGVFLALDTRVPEDHARILLHLPGAWSAPERGWAGMLDLARILAQPAGWYSVLMAACARVLGSPSPTLGVGLGAAWSILLLASVGLLARRQAGAGAALAAVSLAGAMPLLVGWSRTFWVHVPEAALLTAILAAWAGDLPLRRWRTVVVVALGGSLVALLRPSGLAWLVTLLPLALPSLRDRRWGRPGCVLGAWLLAAIPNLSVFWGYLGEKAAARDRYADLVPPLWAQVPEVLGLLVPALALLGVAVVVARRLQPAGEPAPTLVAWVVLPPLLVAVFKSGIDNHVVVVPGLAVLGGLGLARLHRRLPLVLGVLGLAWQALVPLPPRHPTARWARGWFLPEPQGVLQDMTRPERVLGEPEIRALLAASCSGAGGAACTVATRGGLFRPWSDSPGNLELFLMGVRGVRLLVVELGGRPAPHERLVALAEYRCDDVEATQAWERRHPGAGHRAARMRQGLDLSPAWARDIGQGCWFVWSTPGGRLGAAEALPPGDALALLPAPAASPAAASAEP